MRNGLCGGGPAEYSCEAMQEEARATHRDIVVLGASAGGLSALVELVRGLPRDLPAAVFVVVHTSADNPSVLPEILGRAGPLPAAHAVDREPIVPGRIYVALPDHHLLLDRSHVRVTRGPKENGFRPAIDPLFRTAAHVHGPRVIAVVLSGGLNDGTHGLDLVIRRGGIAMAQDPHEALVPSMPLSAIQAVEVHHVLRAADLGGAIARRVLEAVPAAASASDEPPDAAAAGTSLQRSTPPGTQSIYTCPDCGGALWEVDDERTRLLRFRCHVGHAFTAEALVTVQDRGLDDALWTALRALEEHASLYRRMAGRAADAGQDALARKFTADVGRTELRADVIRRALTNASADELPP